MGKGDESTWNTGRVHRLQQGLNPIYVITQQTNWLLHNEFLIFGMILGEEKVKERAVFLTV